MKLNQPAILSISFIFLFIGLNFTLNETTLNEEKENLMLKSMMYGFSKYHYNPVEVNDEFSQNFFKVYLENLDYNKRFLIEDDIKKLEAYVMSLDEAVTDYNYEFFDLSVLLINNGIQRAKGYVNEAFESDFNFDDNDYLEIDASKRSYSKNENDQKKLWYNTIKLDILSKYYNVIEQQEKVLKKDKKPKDFKKKTKKELFGEVKNKSKKLFNLMMSRYEKKNREDFFNLYLNAIASVYDPHTSYFGPIEKENFDISMSGNLEGIGARLVTAAEYTKITEIITGGPAWKEGTLAAGDLIIKVAQADKEAIDITGMEINDVVSKIRGKKGTEVNLTIRNIEGEEKIVTIIRDVVIFEESFAKSLILNNKKESQKNIGYISLPKFYANFKDPTGRHCANDVALEIKKLQDVGVENIILDLRSNTGGSLREVVKMSGLFIEEGPIVQVKARGYKPQVLEDTDDRVLFEGNLIILVNQNSASASEILAAAMQDYNRGVIVGSFSTFGKGTVQRFINLDDIVRGASEEKPLGQIKITTQKFYRINGGSTQLKGVVPDIILPYNYQEFELGEKEHDFALDWTKIDPVDYDQDVLNIKNLDKLKSNSKKRVSVNEDFNLINKNAKRLKKMIGQTLKPLSFEDYSKLQKNNKAESKKYKNIMEDDIEGLEAVNLPVDLEGMTNDESKTARNQEWKDGIHKDIYIHEAMMIMKDMMK